MKFNNNNGDTSLSGIVFLIGFVMGLFLLFYLITYPNDEMRNVIEVKQIDNKTIEVIFKGDVDGNFQNHIDYMEVEVITPTDDILKYDSDDKSFANRLNIKYNDRVTITSQSEVFNMFTKIKVMSIYKGYKSIIYEQYL